MQRQPAVSGQFYPGTAESLSAELSQLVVRTAFTQQVKGIVAPHAGYIYSGAIAGKIYGTIKIPAAVLILGPNHHGIGYPAALYPEGEWLTPLGALKINGYLNKLITQHVQVAKLDSVAHQFEHSLEVQAPFIQYLRPDATISALCLGFGDYQTVEAMGLGLAEAIRRYGEDVLIVASSDMSHYESAAAAKRKDDSALQRLLSFDAEGMLDICRRDNITMCGVVPSAVMLIATKELGASHAELIAYGTSGDVTGDNKQVVAYASVAVW
jgi:AmmeMemoRadiSam system protein B